MEFRRTCDRITIQLINLIFIGSHFERLSIVNYDTIDCAKWLALCFLAFATNIILKWLKDILSDFCTNIIYIVAQHIFYEINPTLLYWKISNRITNNTN